MKKNFVLFFVLTILIGVTYWFEEKSIERKNRKISYKYIISENYDKLSRICLVGNCFSKKGQSFVHKSGHFADEGKLKLLYGKISNLAIVKEVLGEDRDEIRKVSFSVNDPIIQIAFSKGPETKTSLQIGKYLFYDTGLYLKMWTNIDKKARFFIVKEIDKRRIKERRYDYLRFLTFMDYLTVDPFYYFNKRIQIINQNEKLNFARFENRWNRAFEVNFLNKTTLPRVYDGLEYFPDSFKNLASSIQMLKFKSFYDEENFDKTSFAQKVGESLAEGLFSVGEREQKQKKITYSIFEDSKNPDYVHLKTSLNKLIYILDKKYAVFFFHNVQDFWRIRPGSFLSSGAQKLKLHWPQEDKSATFRFVDSNIELYSFEGIKNNKAGSSQEFLPNINKIKSLLNFISSIDKIEKRKNFRFSMLSERDRIKEGAAHDLLLESGKLRLYFFKNKNEMMIFNRDFAYNMHFSFVSDLFKDLSSGDFISRKKL